MHSHVFKCYTSVICEHYIKCTRKYRTKYEPIVDCGLFGQHSSVDISEFPQHSTSENVFIKFPHIASLILKSSLFLLGRVTETASVGELIVNKSLTLEAEDYAEGIVVKSIIERVNLLS